MATSKIRLATASPGTQATTQETLAQLRQIAAKAASNKADILLLPEAYLGGYPRGADFGCKVGARTAGGRDDFLQYFHAAVDLGDTVGNGAGAGEAWVQRRLPGVASPAVDPGAGDGGSRPPRGDGTREAMEEIARDTNVFIVVGLVEKAGGSLYCAAAYVCPRRGIIGKRRKVQPTGTERLIWAQGSPATLKAVTTTIRGVRINLAAAICWESYMPLLRQALYQQNINLYLAPTADGRDAWLALMRTIALEGRCFVVSSNMCVRGDQQQQPPPSTTTTSGGVAESTTRHSPIPTHATGHQSSPRRRNSCLTEEGFEIALPGALPAGGGPGKEARKGRRRSVFDEDGNEIVLGREDGVSPIAAVDEEDAGGGTMTKPSAPETTAGRGPANGGGGGQAARPPSAGFVSRGGSSIVSPMGDVLAGPQWEDADGLLYADVDFEDCIRGRLDLDAAGSYSRNDSFKFSVEGLDLDPLPY